MIRVEVSASVNPTEDRNKVQAAIERIFPALEFTIHEKPGQNIRLVGVGCKDSLFELHRLIRGRKILDTARSNMTIEGNVVAFMLNKQAAAAGKVSFPPDEEPLGSIWVEIDTQNPQVARHVVDWLAPPTEDGFPLFEIELPQS